MIAQEPIRALRELGAELDRVAAIDREQPRPSLAGRLRAAIDYPGAAKRIAAVVVAAALALGGIAYAIPSTRNAVESVVDLGEEPSTTPSDPSDVMTGLRSNEAAAEGGQEGPILRRTPADRLAPGFEVEKGSDEAKATYVIDGVYSSLAAADAKGFCARVSSAFKRQIAHETPGYAGPDLSCEQSFPSLLRAMVDGGMRKTLTAEIIAVDLANGEGTVTVSFRTGKRRKLPVVEENGLWKLGIPD